MLLVSSSSSGLVRFRRGRLRRGAPFAAVAAAARHFPWVCTFPREQFYNGRRGLFLRLHSSDGDSFSVSQRLLCNFYQTRRVWNRHHCFHNVLSSSRYANVVLSRLLDLGSATGHYFLLMLCSFTNKVLARLDLLSCGHELRPAGVNGWFQVASIVSKQTSSLLQRAISTSSIWSTWRC